MIHPSLRQFWENEAVCRRKEQLWGLLKVQGIISLIPNVDTPCKHDIQSAKEMAGALKAPGWRVP